MKILHLASFAGNIGDVANHVGFYSQFSKLIGKTIDELEIVKLEIRKFYLRNRELEFNEKFVKLVNQHDLLVIGGGNFFELCWDYSATGTTFDIDEKILKKLKVPIFINGIGIDDNKGINKENIEKFRSFLRILKEKDVFFTVRNDGSYELVKKYFPEYQSYIYRIPDHGFFVKDALEIPQSVEKNNIGFNIAMDMEKIRYQTLTYNEFLKTIAQQINKICEKTDYNIMLFAHIQSDYLAFMKMLEFVKDNYVRTRISITPLIQEQELLTFRFYPKCKAIFAMRFHANICALSLGVPVIPIITYPKHAKLYEELGVPEWIIKVNDSEFIEKLEQQTDLICSNQKAGHLLADLKLDAKVQLEKDFVYKQLKKWLKVHNFL